MVLWAAVLFLGVCVWGVAQNVPYLPSPWEAMGSCVMTGSQRRREGRQVRNSLEVHLKIVLCSPVHGRSLGVLPRLRLSVAQASAYMAYLNTCGVFRVPWQSSSPTLLEILVSGSLLPVGPAVQTWGPCWTRSLMKLSRQM